MIQYVYAVKDDIAGTFVPYGHHVNRSVAQRAFKMSCNADGVPASDLGLYECGEFDTNTGIYTGYGVPEFIMRGEKDA